jgi:hypothetical protein
MRGKRLSERHRDHAKPNKLIDDYLADKQRVCSVRRPSWDLHFLPQRPSE